MQAATYRTGPHYLLGPSALTVVEWRGAACQAGTRDRDPMLLVFRRDDVDPLSGRGFRYGGEQVRAGRIVFLAVIGDSYASEFGGLRLPAGFSTTDPMAFVL